MSLAMQVAAERTTRSKSARGVPPWKPSTDPPRTFQKHLHQLQYGLPPFRSQRDMSRKLGRKAQEMFLEGIRTQKKIRAQQKEQIEYEKTGEYRLQKAKEVANPTQACNAPWKNADSVPRVFNKFETVEGADSEVRWQERQVELGLMRPRASSAPPGRSFRLNTPYWKEKKPGSGAELKHRTPVIPRVPNCCGAGNAAPAVSYYQYTVTTSVATGRDQDDDEDDDWSQTAPVQHASRQRGFGLGYQGHPEERAQTSLGFFEPPHKGAAQTGSPRAPAPPQRPISAQTVQSRPLSARPYSGRRQSKRFCIELTVQSPKPPRDDPPCPLPTETWM